MIIEKAVVRFSVINNRGSKNFFYYTSAEWLTTSMILFRYNTLFYNTFFIEMLGVDSFSKSKKKNFITYIYIFYMYFYNVKFFFSYSAYYNQGISSISSFFQNAQWPEREMSEMNGSFFFNKLDNRRLLLDYSFIGYPLLKVYPTIGYIELVYSFIISWFLFVPIQFFNYVTVDTYFNA